MWNSDQYFQKATRYLRTAQEPDRDMWEKPFWYALALEHLARAALTKIHPALNADPQGDGLNLLYAFGFEMKEQPRSIPIHAVLGRLERVYKDFKKPRKDFCDFFVMRRNQELHTSEVAFDGLQESKWLAKYYDVCNVLCGSIGRSLIDLLGSDEASTAQKLIDALLSDKMAAILKKIAAHKTIFENKPEEEQTKLRLQQEAVTTSLRFGTTRTHCPSCGSWARLTGSLERVSKPYYEDDELFVKNVFLASRLECGACGLILADIDELHVANVEPRFEQIEQTDLHEFVEKEYYMEYNNM